eukprot:11186147-Karenia_brevis.AAC.1
MEEIAELVGLSMYQEPKTQGKQLTGPNGQGNRPGRLRNYYIRLTGQEWFGGPNGLMSLGEMLQIA